MWQRMWRSNPELIGTAGLMAFALVAAGVGLVIDPRTVTNAPVWLKPAKFAASIAIYCVTLAWIFTWIPEWTRTRPLAGWVTTIALVLEIAIIGVQAWRGTASHFNVGTPLDAALFAVMGVAILIQTAAALTVAIALWRQRFAEASMGWALRIGMSITIAGAMIGGLMVRPTAAQLEDALAGHLAAAGAHTVGAPDGGPGLPGTGWSTGHGDLRVAHFVGLHAMQVLPLIAWLVARLRVHDSQRARLTMLAGGSYAAFALILLQQALRGVSVSAPDATSLAQLAALTIAAAIGAALVLRAEPAMPPATTPREVLQ